jgi:Zn-dependent peptidase ImmA (M78 family)
MRVISQAMPKDPRVQLMFRHLKDSHPIPVVGLLKYIFMPLPGFPFQTKKGVSITAGGYCAVKKDEALVYMATRQIHIAHILRTMAHEYWHCNQFMAQGKVITVETEDELETEADKFAALALAELTVTNTYRDTLRGGWPCFLT